MMRAVLAMGAMLLALPAAAQEDAVGRVKTLTAPAWVISGSERVEAAVGTPIRRKDMVETGAGAALGLSFKDNTAISLGPNSRLSIDEFVFAPAEESYSFAAKIARGTMYFVSGAIARLAPEKVQVSTPVGTIGIRGTRFLVKADDGE
jgi:hypothetical protein